MNKLNNLYIMSVEESTQLHENYKKWLVGGALAGATLFGANKLNKNEPEQELSYERDFDLNIPEIPERPNQEEKQKEETKLEQEPIENVSMQQLIKNAEKWESRKRLMYYDSKGIPTIGIGFNLKRSDAKKRLQAVGIDNHGYGFEGIMNRKIALNNDQIDALLEYDIKRSIAKAREDVGNFDLLPLEVKEIVVDMTFQLGSISRLPKACLAINKGDLKTFCKEIKDSLWFKQSGNRSIHHVNVISKY